MKNLRSKSNRNPKGDVNDYGKNALPLINSINENSLVKLILSPESLLKNLAKNQIDIETAEIPKVETTTIPMKTIIDENTIKPKNSDVKIITTTTDVTTNEIEMNKSESQEFIDNDLSLDNNSSEDEISIISTLSETAEILGEMIDSFISEELLSGDLVNESLGIEEELLTEEHANNNSEKNDKKKITDLPSKGIISNVIPTELPDIGDILSIETKPNEKVQIPENIHYLSKEKEINEMVSDTPIDLSDREDNDQISENVHYLSKEQEINEMVSEPPIDINDIKEKEEEIAHKVYDHNIGDESQKIEIYALPDTIPTNDLPSINIPDVVELTEEIIVDQPNLSTEMLSITEKMDQNFELTTSSPETITEPLTHSPTESPLMHVLDDNGPSPVLENDDLMSGIDSPEITIWPNVPAKMAFPKKFFKKVPPLFRPSALSSRRSAIDDSLAHHDLHSLLKQIRKFRPQFKPRQRKRAIGDEGTLDNIIRPLEKPSVTSAPIQMVTPLQSYEHYFQNSGQSSLEQAEQFEKGLQRLVQFVQIAAHIDSYLTSRFKSGIKTIAKIMESEEVSSSRRLRRYSF